MPVAKKRPVAITEFSNIRVLPSGYQVTLTRARIEFSRHFAGHSDESLRKALAFRDKALRELPPKRLNEVPPAVLRAVGHKAPMVGVYRKPAFSMYEVSYAGGKRRRVRAFRWGGRRNEAEAYAAAVEFRRETLRAAGLGAE